LSVLIIVKGGYSGRRKAVGARDYARRCAEKGAAMTALERRRELDHLPEAQHRKANHEIANDILQGHSLKRIERMARRSL